MNYIDTVDKACPNVLSYCNSIIKEMLKDKFIEIDNNAQQLTLAKSFLGCSALYLDSNGNKLKGLLIFMFID